MPLCSNAHGLRGEAALTASVSDDTLLDLHRRMVRIRLFEETAGKLMEDGKIPGALHLYVGQEAVAAGVMVHLGNEDWITSTHRGHGHLIAKGGAFDRMFAELYGKATGYCKGKGGSMHICAMELGMLGANGIVGGGPPIAVGAAFSNRFRKTRNVACTFFGDGASNEGAFHEAANLAAIYQLPVVFVCENNHYGMSMSADEAFAIEDISARAAAYGFGGITVDGNDLQAVYEAVTAAVERARAGDGPTLVENVTYRWKGHSKSDKNLYRTREEIAEWQARDPIARFEEAVRGAGSLTDAEIEAARKEATQDVREAIRTANAAPPALAGRDVLLGAVYAGAQA